MGHLLRPFQAEYDQHKSWPAAWPAASFRPSSRHAIDEPYGRPPSGRSPALSRVEVTHIVLPGDANALGTIFGGRIMYWVDMAAAVAAKRYAGAQVVTASIDALHFLTPIRIGEVVVLRAQVNAVFRTSMEVGVRVEAEDPLAPEAGRRYATKAYLTFVGRDAQGRPRPLPPLLPETAEERRRQAEAEARRQARRPR
jgi:acyl-CoA hydrolase